MSFELKAHTADVAVEAQATTLEALFGALADGMAACMVETIPAGGGDRFELAVAADDLESVLFDYLDELIFQRDVRDAMPVDNRVDTLRSVDAGYELEATARGIPLSSLSAREVKAVTYADMVVEQLADGWYGYVVFDV